MTVQRTMTESEEAAWVANKGRASRKTHLCPDCGDPIRPGPLRCKACSNIARATPKPAVVALEGCQHWWVLGESPRPEVRTIPARCKRCGATREFPKDIETPAGTYAQRPRDYLQPVGYVNTGYEAGQWRENRRK